MTFPLVLHLLADYGRYSPWTLTVRTDLAVLADWVNPAYLGKCGHLAVYPCSTPVVRTRQRTPAQLHTGESTAYHPPSVQQ